MSDIAEMSLGWETVKSFLGKVVQAAFGFVGTIVFARVLGPTSFGGFYFLLSLVFIVDRPIDGLGQAVRKRYSEADVDRAEILGGSLVGAVGLFVVTAVVTLPLNGVLERQTHVEFAALVLLSILVGRGLFSVLQQMVVASGHLSKQTWNDTLRSVLTLPLQLVLVLGGLGSAGMGYGLAGASLLTAGVAAYVVGERPAVPSRATLRSLWDYAKYSVPSSIVGRVYNRLDVILLGVLVTTGAVGYYEVAFKLTVPGTFVTGIIMTGLMPKISGLASRGEEVATQVTNAASYASILSIPLFFGGLALAEPLVVTVYGTEYLEASTFLVGLALYQVVSSQSGVFMQTIMGLDYPDVKFRINVVTLAFNVLVGVGLILSVGPIGVVVATVLAESFRYVWTVTVAVRHVEDAAVLPRPLVEQVVAGLGMYAFVVLLAGSVDIRSWTQTASLVGAGALFYGAVLLVLSEHLRFTIRSVLADARSG